MSDPAVEAAQRALDMAAINHRGHLINAAREALAPIRADVEEMRDNANSLRGEFNSDYAAGMRYVLDRIAKHVYPSEGPS